MFITWLILFTIITGGILYCCRGEMDDFSDWLMGFMCCLLCVGFILLIIFALGSEIATESAQLEYTTTTIGAIADTNNAVIITSDEDTDVSIVVYDTNKKLSVVEYCYDDCLFENSTKNTVEAHKYTFTNKITRIFFSCIKDTDYTIKVVNSHIIDGTRIG